MRLLPIVTLLALSIPALAQTQPADPQTQPQTQPQTAPQQTAPDPQTAPPPVVTPTPPPVVAPAPPPVQTAPPPPPPAPPKQKPQMFYGGGIGLAFGDIKYVELSPLVGWRFSERFGAGVSLMYRWREDTRYPSSPSYNDYGGTVFARYRLPGPMFLQAEYDYTDYEYQVTPTTTDRQGYSAYLAGVGFGGSVGRGAGAYLLALYDFAYDSNDPYRPYTSPWIIRFGVSVGF